jgi:hypothetical protein
MVRAFEEEAGLDDLASLRNELNSADEPPLEGLPPYNVILFETGQAVAAALSAGVLFCAFLQATGLR